MQLKNIKEFYIEKKIVHLITGNEGGGAEQMLQKLILFSSNRYIHYVIFLKNQNKHKIRNNYNFNFSKNPINFIIEFIKLTILIKNKAKYYDVLALSL